MSIKKYKAKSVNIVYLYNRKIFVTLCNDHLTGLSGICNDKQRGDAVI